MTKKYRAERRTQSVDGVTVSDMVFLLREGQDGHKMSIDVKDVPEVIEALQNAKVPF